jgi:hypothetical protein
MEELVAEDAAESARKVDSNGETSDMRDAEKDEAAITPPAAAHTNQGVMQSSPPHYQDVTGNDVTPAPTHSRVDGSQTKEKI